MMNAKQLSLNATLLALLIILGMTPPIAVGLPVPIVLKAAKRIAQLGDLFYPIRC
jgi:hypothetical protein